MRFFKVLLQTTKLTFPPNFSVQHASVLDEIVTLTVPDGRKWRIGKWIEGLKVGLRENWDDFIEYYSIDEGFFITFDYRGESSFKVVIYDHTACEIEYPKHDVVSSEEELEDSGSGGNPSLHVLVSSDEEVEDLETGRNPSGSGLRFRDPHPEGFPPNRKHGKAKDMDQRRKLDPVKIEDDDSSESSDSDSSKRLSMKRKGKRILKDSGDNQDCRNQNRGSEPVKDSVRKRGRPSKKRLEIDSDLETGSTKKSVKNLERKRFNRNPETEKDAIDNRGMKRGRKATATSSRIIEDSTAGASERMKDRKVFITTKFFNQSASREAYRLARELNLKNTSFMVVLKAYQITNSFVYVPKTIVDKGFGSFKTLEVVDPQGLMWKVRLQRKQSHAYLRGCTPFMQANYLKGGDLCVFELIKSGCLKLWVID